VIAGKALAAFVLGVTSVLVMWLATSLVFGADWGDPLAVVALTVSSVLAATGLSVRTAMDAAGRAPTQAEANRLGQQAAGRQLPVRLVDGGVGAREIKPANYFGPSMAIFFLFFTVSFGARSILIERRQGTLRRLLASAAPPGAVIAGKALAAFVLGVTSVLVMWLATSLVFGADWGEPLAVVALTVSSVLAAIGITALVVTLARTDEQADGYSSLVVFTLALLGGNFIYLAQLPDLLQRLSLLTPNGWALRGFVDLVADGGGLETVAAPVAVTAAFGLVTGAVALVRARRMVVG